MKRDEIIAQEKKLTEEGLAKGNKPKVYTRDFNSSDYQLGYVKGAHRNSDSSAGSDK